MTAQPKYFTTPVGRLISGDPFVKQTKDRDGNVYDKPRLYFAIAIEKTAPGINEFLGIIHAAATEGAASAPAILQKIQNSPIGATVADPFRWKIDDGDMQVVDQNTGQYKLKWPTAQGCWVVKFGTVEGEVTPAIWTAQGPQPSTQEQFYKGCYVQVSGSTKFNGKMDHTSGVYMNPRTILFQFHGERIQTGPSLEEQFKDVQGGYVPAGASQTPVGAPPAGQPPAPGGYAPPAGQPPAGQPPAGQPPAGQPPAGQPPAPGGYAPPAGQPPVGAPPVGQPPVGAPPAGQPPAPGGYAPPAGQPPVGAPPAPAPGGYTPPPPVGAPADPNAYGNAHGTNSAPAGATGSPGNPPGVAPGQPPAYGGYMGG